MSFQDKFIIIDGLLTVEKILKPSYLVRRRVDDKSLKSKYVWVATIAEEEQSEEYEVKGYLARDGYNMVASERRALNRIIANLGFKSGGYERYNEDGVKRATHSFGMGGKKF